MICHQALCCYRRKKLHGPKSVDLNSLKPFLGLSHVLWLRKSRDCLPMAWKTYSWLKLKCYGILQLHGRETNSTAKHELFYAAFTRPFQTMRVCQQFCAYICNFLASTRVYSLWHVSYMLLPGVDWGHSFPTGGLCCSRCAEHLHAPTVLAPGKASDSTAQSFLQWLILLREDSGVSLWGWLCRVRGLEFASNEFSVVLATD